MQPYKISMITVSRNRLHHLQETLPQNLRDNAAYPHLEFIVLDYNSSDGLADWMKANMQSHIDSGRVRYYQTFEPASYHPAHSRNMAFLLADGHLLCNLDADNYTGEGFAAYMNDRFQENGQRVLVTFGGPKKKAPPDTFGRLCVTREDFLAVKGYDEKISTYGGVDIDIAQRVMNLGRETVVMEEDRFLRTIKHADTERFKELPIQQQLQACYVAACNQQLSYVLFLFRDQTFELLTLCNNKDLPPGHQDMIDQGHFAWQTTGLQLSFQQGFNWLLYGAVNGNLLRMETAPPMLLYKVIGQQGMATWAVQYMILKTRTLLQADKTVNPNGLGLGTVYYNFNYNTAIKSGS